ncbi:MAG: hypothetical protein IPQ00_12480 [Chloracidobacterium sp.]|nr:hypothetical protein [Chloracidobacterium sp.]
MFPADQDDVWKSEKIETILNVFRDNLTAGIVVTNAELVDRHLVPLNRNLWESFGFHHSQLDFMNQNVLQILLFGQNFVSGNTIAVRSDLIRFLRTYPIPSNSAHDHWLGLIASLTSAVVVFDYEGIQYRQHQSQLLGAGTSETPFRIALAPADKRFIRIARDAVAYADALRSLVRILDTAETCRAKADIDAIGDEKARKLLAKKVLDLSDKSVHYEIRYHLPVSRLGRLPILLSECKSRRYARYSSGLKSVIYDFLRAKTRDAGR